MKKPLFLLVTTLFIFIAQPSSSQETLTITAPPSIWAQESDGQLTGPIIDLVQKIIETENVKLQTKVLPWARAIDQLKTGELDMMVVIFYTSKRAEFMDFSEPYVQVPTSVFVPKGKTFPIQSLKDLVGLKGVMMRNDSISQEFAVFESNLSIEKVVSYDQVLKMLKSKRADYAVAAQYGFQIHANRLGYGKEIELLPFVIAKRNLHIAVSKKSRHSKHLPHINKQIKQFQKDGTMDEMVRQAIGKASRN